MTDLRASLQRHKGWIEAIREGVTNVTIMDGRVPHSILMELLTDEGSGTMVTA